MQKYLYLSLVCLIVSVGCNKRDLLKEDMLDAQMVSANIDSLQRTLDFVFSDSRFDRKEFEQQIEVGLNRWVSEVIKDGKVEDDWGLSSESEALVEANKNLAVLDRVDEVSFLSSDGYFVQQAAWLKLIGQRVLSAEKLGTYELYRLAAGKEEVEDSVEAFDEIVAELNPDCSEENAPQLANAIRLFDWVTRNIQLDPSVEIEVEQLAQNLVVTDITKTPEETIEFYTDLANRPAGGIRGLAITIFRIRRSFSGGEILSKKPSCLCCFAINRDWIP